MQSAPVPEGRSKNGSIFSECASHIRQTGAAGGGWSGPPPILASFQTDVRWTGGDRLQWTVPCGSLPFTEGFRAFKRRNARSMNEILNQIRALAANSEDRVTKARELARIIREHGQYRWVGVYDVGPEEVAIFGWSGPGTPAHPTFPITRGLTASAISQGAPIIVADVRNDPRYLTAFSSTLSEIIVPVLDDNLAVVGTIDVESERANAFSDRDRVMLEQCANAARLLWLKR